MKTPILVTGATGRHGGTGHAVVEKLLERGVPVRALVRTVDERATALEKQGVELAIGDYGNYASLQAALKGVEAAYFCYPVAAGINEAAGFFAGAGRSQGLQWIVDLSLATTRVNSPSPQGRAQCVTEQIFEWAGFGGVHLRIAAFFMENILLMDSTNIRTNRRISNSFGNTPLSWIAGADVGGVATELLVNPSVAPNRVFIAGGVQKLTYGDIAATVGAVTGQKIDYDEVSPEQWRLQLLQGAKAAGVEVNERGIDHLVAQSVALKASPESPATDDVLRITGEPPLLFEKFAAKYSSRLGSQIARTE